MKFLEYRNAFASVVSEISKREPLLERDMKTMLRVLDSQSPEIRVQLEKEISGRNIIEFLPGVLRPVIKAITRFATEDADYLKCRAASNIDKSLESIVREIIEPVQ